MPMLTFNSSNEKIKKITKINCACVCVCVLEVGVVFTSQL